MLYGVKRSRGSSCTVLSALSSEAFMLTWLVYGLLPLTQSAGLGSNIPFTREPPILPSSLSQPEGVTTSSLPPTNGSSNNAIPNHLYHCPPTPCQCEYSRSSQTLEINCSAGGGTTAAPVPERLDLSGGVRVLRISHALLDTKSMGMVPALVQDTLVELDLLQVRLDPKSFFTSSLFVKSRGSLRKLTIRRGSLLGDNSDAATFFQGALQPFTSLKSMDSLNICDSSPSLATILLQTMPHVVHLQAVNNSLYDIPYASFPLASTSHQYSVQSIDLSKNHLALIPTGLLDGLTELQSLDVSHNRIFHLQEQVFTGLKSLRKLNVSHNQIEYVDAEVFTPLPSIKVIDISNNDVVQFFEPYFNNNKELEALYMSNMWVAGTFSSAETALRSLIETERLINSLSKVKKLDISDNGMMHIPETLTHAPLLQQLYMDGNRWECSCQDRWFIDWIATSKVSIGDTNTTENMWCFYRKHTGETVRHPFYQYLKNLTMACTSNNIIAKTPYKFYAVMGKDKQLTCHAQKPNWPKITWITPSKQLISASTSDSSWGISSPSHFRRIQQRSAPPLSPHYPRIAPNGSLLLSNVTSVDYGLYLCIASYQDLNITHYVHLGMDVNVFKDVRLVSILVGWTFAFSFLVLVLILQLIKCILRKLGLRCFFVNTTKQTRRVRAFFDSMEQNKNSQLDWLRDNYNMQAKKIKDNCYSQLDRIRESYSTQSKNLGEIRDYGTQQLHTLRDQYNDQVRRVANYSAHQLCKVRENYVFKRNQVCKFSSHQLLRLRETYKWQAQTLNKILENLPRGLNFDTCRGMGACGRTDSIYLDDMGEEFIGPHETAAEVYHVALEARGLDKLEHVSLLIPPEFVAIYNYNQHATSSHSCRHLESECSTSSAARNGNKYNTVLEDSSVNDELECKEVSNNVELVEDTIERENEAASEITTTDTSNSDITPPTETLPSTSTPSPPDPDTENNDTTTAENLDDILVTTTSKLAEVDTPPTPTTTEEDTTKLEVV